jgi:hypothetical protein
MKTLLCLLLIFMAGCSQRHNSLVLIERGVAPFEREFHVRQEGYGIERRVQQAFLRGYVEPGMNQEMVRLLWGPPNRDLENSTVWEYTNRKGELITRVHFIDNPTPSLGMKEKVVDYLEGDRFGGSNPPSSESTPR